MSTPNLPNVARAGVIMMLSLFLSRVLGIVREMIIAAKFGMTVETDAYKLAFSVPDLLFFLIAGGALSSAFIPVFSEYLHTDREDEAWKIFSVVVTFMSLLVGALIAVAWVFALPLAHLIAPGKMQSVPPEQAEHVMELIAHMSRIVLPAQFAFFIGGILFGTLYARQRFAAPGLGPNIYNLGIIFGAVALSSLFNPGVIGMSWGALIGAILGNLLVPLLAMRAVGAHFKPSLDLSHPGVKKVFRLMLPVVLGLSLPGVYALIMQAFGSYFTPGANSWLDTSNKLMQAPLGIFGQSLAIAVFPALTQFYAQDRMDLFRNQLNGTMRTVLYLTLPVSTLLFVLAPEVVALFFQHGKFTPEDTVATAGLLRMFSIGIAAWCLHPVLMRGFFAVQSPKQPIVLGTIATALFVTLTATLMRTPLALQALPLASSISAIALIAMLLVAASRRLGGIDFVGLGSTAGKALVGCGAMGLLLWLGATVFPVVPGPGRTPALAAEVLLISLVGAWAYYFVTKAFKMPEAATVDRALARLDRRKKRG